MKKNAALHVTNGDAVLYLFGKAGLGGTHLGWRDPLVEGPVPAGLGLRETSAVRAGYLGSCGYGAPIKVIREFGLRDEALLRAREYAETVLWFEHDLFDQLQLLQVLVTLDGLGLEPGMLSTIQSDTYLGTMTLEELLALMPRRRVVTEAVTRSARRTWERFTSQQPLQLNAAAAEDSIGLPFVRAAMRRLCEEFPGARDGLSRTERGALQAVAQGPTANEELYRRAQRREEASFHSERGFFRAIDALRGDPGALIEGADGALGLTALGRRVLSGAAEWTAHRELDRWIGGTHLTGRGQVRWDDERERLVEVTA